MEIVVSDDFLTGLEGLSADLQERTLSKVRLLSDNPAHPSLNAHRVKRTQGKWECYVTDGYRLIYELAEGQLRLWRVGDHSIVDRAHQLSFSAHTAFRRLDVDGEQPEQTTATEKPFVMPQEWLKPEAANDNPFRHLPAAHLRILGVPAFLVRAVQAAPSLDAAVGIPGLPEHTVQWLMDLVTNPDLEDVVFDPGRLIFRTTLDRLEGYCQGKLKRLMLNLEPEQQRYVDRKINGALLLRGCAGSGKTTVALYRAIAFAEAGRRTVFLTFNKTLAQAAQVLMEELIGPLPSNLEVVNIDAWLMRFLRSREVKIELISNSDQRQLLMEALKSVRGHRRSYVLNFPWTFFRDEIARVIKGLGLKKEEDYLAVPRYGRSNALQRSARSVTWKVYSAYEEALRKNGWVDWQDVSLSAYRELFKRPLDTTYDHVIIDEAQDLTAMQVRVAQRMMKGGGEAEARSIFLAGDSSQTLYSRGFTWKQAGLQLQGRSVVIRRNFRNTRQIAEAAAALNEYNTLTRIPEEYVDPLFTSRQGPRPIRLECDVTEREPSAVVEKILDLAGDNRFRLSDFAVLCPTVQLVDTYRQRLEHASIPCMVRGENRLDILDDKIKVLTIHSAKGLEFPVVFLTGLHEGVLPQTARKMEDEEAEIAIERDRTLAYVGMTRAAEALYLVTSLETPSSFLNEISRLLRPETYNRKKTS